MTDLRVIEVTPIVDHLLIAHHLVIEGGVSHVPGVEAGQGGEENLVAVVIHVGEGHIVEDLVVILVNELVQRCLWFLRKSYSNTKLYLIGDCNFFIQI